MRRIWRLADAEIARHPHVPEPDRRRARIVIVPTLPPGVRAMTLGRLVLVRTGQAGDRVLLAHELVHVRQWREQGPVGFLLRYLREYLRGRMAGLGHREAYLAIGAEVEARRLAAAVTPRVAGADTAATAVRVRGVGYPRANRR